MRSISGPTEAAMNTMTQDSDWHSSRDTSQEVNINDLHLEKLRSKMAFELLTFQAQQGLLTWKIELE